MFILLIKKIIINISRLILEIFKKQCTFGMGGGVDSSAKLNCNFHTHTLCWQMAIAIRNTTSAHNGVAILHF
ncbi:hypothetical protein T4B_9016 [Trichinella pseudospiralis]|uniref:Uncharacterized protein n=1 Tax=Trichinella pseudospiralis TaxID=6337 RepID=A0A0V1JBX6_TRIPS|nr:hypothetical protein T4B_9016 [Trichinella pseudospiralis]KRZ32486.1 hypothetical protein T4C_2644 [Trichinella pseudospiralis]